MLLLRNTQKKVPLDLPFLRESMKQILTAAKHPHCDIHVWFCGLSTMKSYNNEHRNVNKPTDVLSLSPHLNLCTAPGEQPSIPEFCGRTDLGLLMIAPQYILQTHPHFVPEEEKFVHNIHQQSGRRKKKEITLWENASPLHQHLVYLMTHGTCHLLGYEHDDDTQYRSMRAKEVHIMRHVQKHQPTNVQKKTLKMPW